MKEPLGLHLIVSWLRTMAMEFDVSNLIAVCCKSLDRINSLILDEIQAT